MTYKCWNCIFLKMGHSRPLFYLFLSFQYTVDSNQMFNKFCQWLDSNRGPLVSEATALPTEPHNHCPQKNFLTTDTINCKGPKFHRNFCCLNSTSPIQIDRSACRPKTVHLNRKTMHTPLMKSRIRSSVWVIIFVNRKIVKLDPTYSLEKTFI